MMLDAVEKAIATLKAYVGTEEASYALEDEMACAIEHLLRAIGQRNIAVAEEYDHFLEWLEGRQTDAKRYN